MSYRAHKRQASSPFARRALALFVVAWLNVVVQPCAMALTGGPDSDCIHCPPEHAQHHDGHEMANQAEAPCASDASGCDALDEFNHDTRTTKLKTSLQDLPLCITSPIRDVLAAPRYTSADFSSAAGPPDWASPPLHKLHCAYLI